MIKVCNLRTEQGSSRSLSITATSIFCTSNLIPCWASNCKAGHLIQESFKNLCASGVIMLPPLWTTPFVSIVVARCVCVI